MSRYRQSMREALEQVAQVEVFNEAVKWEVKISGLPVFYVDGKSRGEVKQGLRRMLKKPDDIESIERTTSAALKKIRRGQAQGDEPGETNEEVEDAYDYKAKKGAIAAPGSGSIAKAKKAKSSDVNKSIEQQMKDALKEKMSVDDVVNMIQFGKPFKVVDEDIPAELPPGDPNFPKYKDIPNSVIDKEDKKANKVKDKAEKDTLVPTQTQEGVGVTDDSGYTRYPSSGNWAGIKTGQKKTKSHAEIRKAIDPKGVAGKDLDKRISKSLRGEDVEVEVEIGETSDRWKINFKKQSAKRRGEAKRRQEAQRDSPGQRVLPRPKKEEVEIDEKNISITGKDKNRKVRRYGSDEPKNISIPPAGRAAAERSTRKLTAKKAVASKMGKIRWRQNKGAVEEVEMNEWGDTSILHQKSVALQGRPGLAPKRKPKDAQKKDAENQNKDPVGKQHEVAPPGWGHTKAEYEKTKPDKPKSKIGGSAAAFDRARKEGRFKGSKEDMFKLMWWMKNKGGKPKGKPHYKPGTDEKKKKYKKEENILDSAKRYLIQEKSDWNTAFKSAAQSRPAMKYKDAVSFIDTAGLNSMEKRSALKAAKKWLR